MVQRLLSFIKRPTSKHIIINTVGNYLNVGFTAFFALLLVRILTPSQYGVLSVLLGIAYVLANILDFGTTATIYSYLPPMIENPAYRQAGKNNDIYRFIKSTFFYQSIFSIIVITLLFVSFPYLDKVFFKTNAPNWELYVTSISVLFFIWQNFISNCLFAAKKFLKVNIYLNFANIIKTLIIFVMAINHTITVGSIIFVFGILGPVFFFLFLFLEKKDLIIRLLKSDVKQEEFRFKYTLTFFIASQFQNLGLRMDLFLLSYFRSKPEVGFYGLAQKIILTIMTTIISITQVLSPTFSKITTKKEVKHYMKTGLMYLMLPACLFLALFLLPNQIYFIFFTDKFASTAAITKSLSIPFIIYTFISLPMLFLLYTVKKPRYILVSNIVFFILVTILCFWLIPIKGVSAPPIAITISLIVSGLIQTGAFIIEYKKLP